jgi:hypothetical protein
VISNKNPVDANGGVISNNKRNVLLVLVKRGRAFNQKSVGSECTTGHSKHLGIIGVC